MRVCLLVQIIKQVEHLDMDVCNVGRVPGSFETHQTYAWVDPIGRSVSPPPEVDRIGRYNNSDERKSGLMLLKDSDERKVGSSSLWLFIRWLTDVEVRQKHTVVVQNTKSK